MKPRMIGTPGKPVKAKPPKWFKQTGGKHGKSRP